MPKQSQYDVVVLGPSLSGNLAACYLRKHHPDLRIAVVGKRRPKQPIVGESLTEFSTHLLHHLGFAEHLEEKHFHKYGLTFYFKESLEDPSCRSYAVHEAPAIPPLPSNQLNRFVFDQEVMERNRASGVDFHEGQIIDCEVSPLVSGGESFEGHRVRIRADGERDIFCRWLIDASGRGRVLARSLGLQQAAPFQRSSFWFRVADFDRNALYRIQAAKDEHYAYDSYYVTHHFFGHGNWIWCIPMQGEEGEHLMSVGIVWRPDVYEGEVRSVDDFIERVSQEHPVVTDLVNSGRIVDHHLYRNYMYECQQVYSRSGWFIVGDAGDTVDPLYSTGIVMTSLQLTQVSEMIARSRAGSLSEECVRDFESAFKVVRSLSQREISTFFEVIHDPYQSHWRMHFSSLLYFYCLLPAWLSGYMSQRFGARFLRKALLGGFRGMQSIVALLPKASMRMGKMSATDVRNKYRETVNWELWGAREEELPRYLSAMLWRFAKYRWQILRDSGWHRWHEHLFFILADLFKAGLFASILRNRRLSKLRVLRVLMGVGEKDPQLDPLTVTARGNDSIGVQSILDRMDKSTLPTVSEKSAIHRLNPEAIRNETERHPNL